VKELSKKQQTKTETKSRTVYSRSELIEAASSSFGVKPEVIAGALRLAGKESMTKAEAERAIKSFLQRRVK